MTLTLGVLDRGVAIADPDRVDGGQRARPDPQVPERARRRTFTAKYKMQILADYDAAGDGEKGALLRREGLYTSHIAAWRRARDAGALAGLTAPRGRPRNDSAAEQIARLQAEKKQRCWSWPRPASWSMCRQNYKRSVRHEALGRIPGSAGRDLKGGSWV